MNVTPFLLFDGNCAEAMTFYHSCLGGELSITKVAETPMKAQVPAELHQKVAFAHLASGAVEISATDWQHPTRRFNRGNTVGVYLTSDNASELKTPFERLCVGADPNLLDSLTEMPFGVYGHLCDAYGVHWFFRGDHDREETHGA